LVPLSARAVEDDKADKPKLELRAHPRNSFSPATVKFFAELDGGDDLEEYYCPEVEWEWGDGTKSLREADCEPWEPGTKIKRLFIETHTYRSSGLYRVRIELKRLDDAFVAREVDITVRPGPGDPGY
jgi:hypothetical protein